MGLIPEHQVGEAKHKVRFFFFPPSAINFKLLILNHTERVKTSSPRALCPLIAKALGLGQPSPASSTEWHSPALPAAQGWTQPRALKHRSSPTEGQLSPASPGQHPRARHGTGSDSRSPSLPCWEQEALPTLSRASHSIPSCVPAPGLLPREAFPGCPMPGGSSSAAPVRSELAQHSFPGHSPIPHPRSQIPDPSPGPALPSWAVPQAQCPLPVSLPTLPSPGTKCKSVAVPASIKNFKNRTKQTEKGFPSSFANTLIQSPKRQPSPAHLLVGHHGRGRGAP